MEYLEIQYLNGEIPPGTIEYQPWSSLWVVTRSLLDWDSPGTLRPSSVPCCIRLVAESENGLYLLDRLEERKDVLFVLRADERQRHYIRIFLPASDHPIPGALFSRPPRNQTEKRAWASTGFLSKRIGEGNRVYTYRFKRAQGLRSFQLALTRFEVLEDMFIA